MTTKDGADQVTALAADRFGRLDCAVNAAGVEGGLHPLDACDDAEFEAVMSVNLWGVFRCMRVPHAPRVAGNPPAHSSIADQIALGRMGTVTEIAEAAVCGCARVLSAGRT